MDAGSARAAVMDSVVPIDVAFVEAVELDGGATLFAFLSDGGLTVALEDTVRSVERVSLDEDPRGLALSLEPVLSIWVSTASGLSTFRRINGGVRRVSTTPLSFPATHLRHLTGSSIAAWGASTLSVHHGDGGHFVSSFDAGVRDVLRVPAGLAQPDGGVSGSDSVLLMTDCCLLAAPGDRPLEWRRVSLDKASAITPAKLVWLPESRRLVGVSNENPPALVQGGFVSPEGATSMLRTETEVLVLNAKGFQPCERVEAIMGASASSWRLFCRELDGGLTVTETVDQPVPVDRTLRLLSSDARVLAGPGSALRARADDTWRWVTPSFRALNSLFGRASQPVIVTTGSDAGLVVLPATCATHGTSWLWCEPGGEPQTRVRGRANWAIASQVRAFDLETGRVTAVVADAGLGVSTAVWSNDVVIASSDSALWVGAERLNVAPGGAPSSLAASSPRELFIVSDGGVSVLTREDGGWAVSRLETGPASAVWTDGARGRVVLRDGSVRLLPSGVEAVRATNQTFLEVEAFCGRTFALTTTGVVQLVVDDAGSRWTALDLGDGPLGTFSQAHLLSEENALLVVFSDAAPRLVRSFDCLP